MDLQEGGPGLVYWADFLNLLAEGPVPWRKEIEEAVNACSKMVCIIDEAWVTSFNCLQELAFAIREEKPVVVLVLDQLGWEFLTVPGGSKRAWDVSKWGPSLSSYAGQEIVPGEPFTLQTVENLYSYLSGINLCACRKLEVTCSPSPTPPPCTSPACWPAQVTNFGGMQGLLDNMRKYVTKDLLYFKQHAELKEYARKWEQAGKPSSVLLHRKEALKWQQWVDNAESMGAMPSPTALQKMFVKHSMLQARNMILRCAPGSGSLVAAKL